MNTELKLHHKHLVIFVKLVFHTYSVSRPSRAGFGCAIDTWPIFLGSFMWCPPSGDGRVFKPWHRPGGAEFFRTACVINVIKLSYLVNPVGSSLAAATCSRRLPVVCEIERVDFRLHSIPLSRHSRSY